MAAFEPTLFGFQDGSYGEHSQSYKRRRVDSADLHSLPNSFGSTTSSSSTALAYDPVKDAVQAASGYATVYYNQYENHTRGQFWHPETGPHTFQQPYAFGLNEHQLAIQSLCTPGLETDEVGHSHNSREFQQYSSQAANLVYEDISEVVENHQQTEGVQCFGMISDTPIISHQSGLSAVDSSSLTLEFRSPNSLYHPGRDVEFGTLEERAAKILARLSSEHGIEFHIYSRPVNRRPTKGAKGGKKSTINDVQSLMNATIYGPTELCEPVGEYLAKCGIFLQDPIHCDRDVVYRNPHILSRSEEAVMTSSLVLEKSNVEVQTLDAPQDLFSKLSQDDHLSLTEAPDAVSTTLYRHQKKALSFMAKREQGWMFDGSQEDLWVKEVDDAGGIIYTNLITEKSQSSQPPESRGGLLADQMGLGKSLTMISLIALSPAKIEAPVIYTSQGTIRRIKSTLVVVPYSLLETWDAQLRRHLKPHTLSWMRFHGSQKRKVLSLGSHDIVITTFETLAGQQKKHIDSKYIQDTLFSFSWHRIVLDEAHTIRNRVTSMAQACCAIRADNRWAITGTPIQNRATDFASLLEYLQLYPFSSPKIFDTEIIKPWLKSDMPDVSRLKKLVNCISLCRTKAIIDLPKRKDEIHYLDFSAEEQIFYESKKSQTIQRLDEALSSTPLAPGRYLNALQWLNELRLICNHGLAHSRRELPKSSAEMPREQIWNKATAEKAFETLASSGQALCKLCLANITGGTGEAANSELPKPSLSRCLTLICGSCIQNRPKGQKVPTCSCAPMCPKVDVSWAPESSETLSETSLPCMKPTEVSTKLKALMKSLQEGDCSEKSVVFSYWTYTLDLIESLLKAARISYTRIDGKHSGEKRERAIHEFQTDESIRVILVSITCGGAGLDLTAATCAYLLEPQWNPMIEEQALCRIHRLGQRKEVRTIRYRIRGSFEEKVAMTQEMKKDIAAWAFSDEQRAEAADGSCRLQDLREAFR